jgi:hypothetical protein
VSLAAPERRKIKELAEKPLQPGIGDQVDVVGRAREVGAQVHGPGIKAGEHEATVALDLGR